MSAERSLGERNIVVVGKTGTGKSTVANVILNGIRGLNDKKTFTVKSSATSVTSTASCSIATVFPHGFSESGYRLKVIDTVGLFDTGSTKTNKQIVRDLRDYFIKNIENGVNLVLFVMKKDRFTAEEEEVFSFLMKHFSREIGELSALLITHCDSNKESERKEYIEGFKKSPRGGKVARFMGKGIYAVGFPDFTTIDEDFVPAYEKKAQKDIDVVRGLVFSSDRITFSKQMWDSTQFWEKVERKAEQDSTCNIL